MTKQPYFDELEKIFRAGVKRVDPYRLIDKHLSLQHSRLEISADEFEASLDLENVNAIYVIGAGKATARMAKAVENILGPRITGGAISVKYGHTDDLKHIKIIEAGHPIPDNNGIEAARKISELAKSAGEKDLLITLISGGGSALTPCPFEYEGPGETMALSLDEKQAATKILLESGATINEVNCIRKHLSGIKGGRLARLMYPAASYNFILSDVVGDSLDAIASGPTTFDASTFADIQRILNKYDLENRLPRNVLGILTLGLQGKLPETPKQGDAAFEKTNNILIGSNMLSLEAAAETAAALGFRPVVLSSQIVGEAKEAAKVLCGIAKDVKKHGLLAPKPVCLIAGGETTVTIRGKGKGGRNQELALSFLAEMENDPGHTHGIYFLSASTDGNDGPTDAAGAFASNDVLKLAKNAGLYITGYLKNNDAYRFFDRIGALLKTGPTNTNVCDMQIVIVK